MDNWADNQVDNQADNWADNWVDNQADCVFLKERKRCKQQKDVNDKKLGLF